MANSDIEHLAAGPWQLEVQPARGGGITVLRHLGRTLLVSPDPATEDAMGAASFVLVPYANRIANGALVHAGRQRLLPRNFGDHPHPLHGTGWKRPWEVTQCHADVIDMQLQHSADADWPWSFSAFQRVSLTWHTVRFELTVTNTSAEIAPMGVGFHPAFAACAATILRTKLEGVWLTDADSLPVTLAPAATVLATEEGTPVLRDTLVDHCFTGWPGELNIHHVGYRGEIARIQMRASLAMRFLQLYMPPDRGWFCAEPMSQMPDAIHHDAAKVDTGLRLLAPGESLQVWMTLAVDPADEKPSEPEEGAIGGDELRE